MNLRKAAQGRECTVRIPGICNFDPATTVLAHLRRGGAGGMGIKPPDVCGVLACSDCHDVLDWRRKVDLDPAVLDSYALDALCRTLATWVREGLL